MVYDVFTFFYELDLLEIRLNILDEYVDKFVIVESTESFIGEPKRLYFKENKDRFKKWEHKIIHYIVDDFPNNNDILQLAKSSPNTGNGEHWWIREFYQKECIKNALKDLEDGDICYISDVDEIWNPLLSYDLEVCNLYRPTLDSYLYYLNLRTSADKSMWTGTIITNYKTVKNSCLNHLRTRSMTDFIELDNGGWHFEAFGGISGAKNKIDIVKHPDYYNTWNLSNNLESRILTNQDYKGRNLRVWKDGTNLPEFVKNNLDKYNKFLI